MPPRISIPRQPWLEIQGMYGDFTAPGSESTVSYLLTQASLGSDGSGNSQLTRKLVPVRELFDVGDLNFEELLQRDLDDHRVATEIIPYLLDENPNARFFPPILAAILPVDGRKALDYYPEKKIIETREDAEYIKEVTSFGNIFEIERFKLDDGRYATDTKIKLNQDKAKLVVLDGQHRAMAILAIKRSQNGEWGDRGSDYKHFYEDIAYQLKNTNTINKITKIELPVCLAFLPELSEQANNSTTLIQAFRRLFLDVNKEARKPTRARQLLLDDSHIISILSRSVLSKIRSKGAKHGLSSYSIDLDSFEYDSPRESPKPQRDLALCTIEMIYELVRWTLFADDDFYTNLKKIPSTGRPILKCSRFLSEINSEEEITSEELSSWGFTDIENELDATNIPISCQKRISELFMKNWGEHIITFLAQLHPLQAHIKSVSDLRASHISETGHGKLAWRALFDGQGIYWTIKNYTEHRKAESASLGSPLPVTDVEKAYQAITQRWIPEEFEKNRAKKYFNISSSKNPSEEEILSSKRSFSIFRTMAFQIGFLMSVAFLKKKLNIKNSEDFSNALGEWISAWNLAFKIHPKSSHGKNSLLIFDTQGKGLMSRHFGRLQKSEWIWFRYFAFEMLDSTSKEIDYRGKTIVGEIIDITRYQYIKKLSNKIIAEDKKQGLATTKEEALSRSFIIWRKALNHSLGIKMNELDQWWEKAKSSDPSFAKDTDNEDSSDSDNGDNNCPILEDDSILL